MTTRAHLVELNRVLERTATVVYAVDAERRLIYLNRAARELLGPAAADLLGQECRFHSQSSDPHEAVWTGLLCPPPEALAGAPTTTRMALSVDPAQPLWIARHLPLWSTDPCSNVPSVVGVLTFAVRGDAIADTDAAPALTAWAPPATATENRWHDELRRARHALRLRWSEQRLLGKTPAMTRVRAQIAAAATNQAAVLIVGPVGSGRQHVARAIHTARNAEPDSRSDTLLPIDCALIGAESLQAAIRELARLPARPNSPRGTLLLNNVDQLTAEAAAELLGFLKLGSLPLSLLATARANPWTAPRETTTALSDQLWASLSTLVIELPALVERLADLPLLAQAFVEEFNAAGSKQLSGLTPEAIEQLALYSWPGQVAELYQFVRSAHAAATTPRITLDDLPPRLAIAADAARHPRRVIEPIDLAQVLADVERELLRRALEQARGNKARAARLVGLTRPRFYRRLVQLGLAEVDDAPENGKSTGSARRKRRG